MCTQYFQITSNICVRVHIPLYMHGYKYIPTNILTNTFISVHVCVVVYIGVIGVC